MHTCKNRFIMSSKDEGPFRGSLGLVIVLAVGQPHEFFVATHMQDWKPGIHRPGRCGEDIFETKHSTLCFYGFFEGPRSNLCYSALYLLFQVLVLAVGKQQLAL